MSNVKGQLSKVLILNAGSSSLRFELFDLALKSLFRGHFDNHAKPITNFDNAVSKAIKLLLQKKKIKDTSEIKIIGHRVVHGGSLYSKPTRITPKVIAEIKKLFNLAPLHNPPNLACILACKKLFPKTPQVAVFDTAFHVTMPEKAFLYGLPYSFYKKYGIRRYGFHGISHQYVFEQARKKFGATKTKRVVTCHLGNGCSITAILNGKVIDTSMGFTPLEGAPMGSRSGDIDPSIIFYLLKKGFSAKEINNILNNKSGLLGISELSPDVRDLWAAYKKGPPSPRLRRARKKAIRALEWFAYRIAKYIGAYTAALGGLDCVVFTGGIGENAWYLRKWIMAYIKGIARPRVLVIKTNEEKKIAEEVCRLIQ